MESPGAAGRADRWSRSAAFVAFLTVVAAILRFSTLDDQSFWYDESITAELLGMGFGEMLREIPDSESTPPLYYVLAWVWTQAVGSGDAAIRSLSAVVGTLTIPVVYAAGSRLISPRAGLIAAALCALHPYLIWYSQEARAYALLVLLSALAFLYFADALRDGARRPLVLWGVFSCLAFATHYFAAFVVIPEALVLLRARPARRTVTAVAGAALGHLALLPLLLEQRATGNAAWISDEPVRERVELVVEYFAVGRSGTVANWLLAIVLLLAVSSVVLLARGWRRRGPRAGELAALAIGAGGLVTPALLAVVGLDYFWHQNLIAALVPLIVLVAAGFAEAPVPRMGAALAVALSLLIAGIGLVTTHTDSSLHRDDFKGAAHALGAPDGPRVVVMVPEWCTEPLERYMPDLEPVPMAGVRVREVAVVTTTENHGCVRTGIPDDAPPPIAGFTRAGVRRFENMLVLRYRGERPALARPDELDLLYQREWAGNVLWQEPGR